MSGRRRAWWQILLSEMFGANLPLRQRNRNPRMNIRLSNTVPVEKTP
jgi:hypothetical protein